MGDCTERFRNFAERFRNRSAKFQNRSAQSLSETQRKMSSRFLLIPLKDDDETTTTTRMRGHLQHHRCDFHVHDASATRTCKIKASKKRVLIKHFSLRISKTFQNNFFFDRSTMMPKTTSRRRRR